MSEDDEKDELIKATKDFLSNLSPREAKVLRKRFGTQFSEDATLEEIGSKFDVTRKRILEIQQKSTKKT